MLLPAATFALEPGEGRARATNRETAHLLHARLSSSTALLAFSLKICGGYVLVLNTGGFMKREEKPGS